MLLQKKLPEFQTVNIKLYTETHSHNMSSFISDQMFVGVSKLVLNSLNKTNALIKYIKLIIIINA